VLAADEDQGRPYIVMELMPGDTLDDLVRQDGPLPPEQAIRKILDVIDGLNEAHEIGLIHRDVKPGNCFLEADGRVKIGDFGLAKSLLRASYLTRTGTFLGTPLFAAPEQIKREASTVQDDVYSVAATLYFLLTGQAPFQSGEAMATMARIVSEDPPPMRTLRPDLPRALDDVVLRGLARERNKRWCNLEQFRRALLPLLPAEVSVGGLGLRFGAFLLDAFLLSLAREVLLGVLVVFLEVGTVLKALAILAMAATEVVYFGVLEGRFGWSVGKRALRLRVSNPTTHEPPGLKRAQSAVSGPPTSRKPAVSGPRPPGSTALSAADPTRPRSDHPGRPPIYRRHPRLAQAAPAVAATPADVSHCSPARPAPGSPTLAPVASGARAKRFLGSAPRQWRTAREGRTSNSGRF
jgi:hypothetical protein